MASQTLASISSTGSHITATGEIRQKESADTSHIILQGRLTLEWSYGYESDYDALFQISSSSSTTANPLLNIYYSFHKTLAAGSLQTEWQDLTAINASETVSLWCRIIPNGGSGAASDKSQTVTVTGIKRPYTLTLSQGEGSSISVARQSTQVASTGSLSSGSIVYKDDSLKISAVPNQNYGITSLKVNGSSFTSGNSHIVAGNVSVVSTAQVLASDVGASDADIESSSTVTVTKYASSYVHSLQYSFGSLSGYIAANGTVSTSEVKFSSTTVSFKVPTSFYQQIPNAVSGVCTITCRTYASASSTTVLGTQTTCTFTARASASKCSPTVSGTVKDTNETTLALTQDANKIVRYISNALCTISATAKNGASIKSKTIGGTKVTGNTRTITGDALTQQSIRFSATDSRGFTTSVDVPVSLIMYVKLTCNPEIKRKTPTGGDIVLSINGKTYTDAAGWRSGKPNVLSIQYCYKKSTASTYSGWQNVSVSTQANSAYKVNQITIPRPDGDEGFDYREAYDFRVKVTDGDGTNVCSTVTLNLVVQEGIPVFDWGKNDFKFNVPVYINDTKAARTYEQSVAASGTITFDVTSVKCGFILTAGARSAIHDIIIFHVDTEGVVTFTQVCSGSQISVSKSTYSISIQNNSPAWLYAMMFVY